MPSPIVVSMKYNAKVVISVDTAKYFRLFFDKIFQAHWHGLLFAQLVPKLLKMLFEQFLVTDNVSQFSQCLLVRGVGNPELDVTVVGIFLVHVAGEAQPLLLFRLFWIIFLSILDGAYEYLVYVDVAVGLCHYFAIDAAWLAA